MCRFAESRLAGLIGATCVKPLCAGVVAEAFVEAFGSIRMSWSEGLPSISRKNIL